MMIPAKSRYAIDSALIAGLVFFSTLAFSSSWALATERLTAIVQAIAAPSQKLRPYDILAAGTRIELQPGESIDIGYFASCQVEHIIGGTIVVNDQESWVVDGTLERRKIDCANGGAVMQGAEMDAAVVVVRDAGLGKERVVGDPRPLIMAPGLAGKVPAQIRRLDNVEEIIVVDLVDGVLDLSYSGKALTPGAEYEIRSGKRHARFRVAPKPGADMAEILSRLILF